VSFDYVKGIIAQIKESRSLAKQIGRKDTLPKIMEELKKEFDREA
jgi:hypothetical protein